MNIDDPKLTAYALGELSSPERAEIEKQLRDDPEARAYVEETAVFGAMLGNAFHAEQPPEELALEQRSEVIRQSTRKIVPFRVSRTSWQAGIGALAASAAIALLFTWSMGPLSAPELADTSRTETPVLNGMVAANAPAAAASASMGLSHSMAVLDSKEPAATAPSLPSSTTIAFSAGKAFMANGSDAMGSLENANTYTGTTTITAGTLIVSSASAAPSSAPTGSEVVALAQPVTKAKGIQADQPASSESYADRLVEAAPAAPSALKDSDILASSGQVVAMESKTAVVGRSVSAAQELSRADARLRQLSQPEKAKNIKGESFTQTASAPVSTVALMSGTGDSIADLRHLIQSGQRPLANAIPMDALINSFQNGTGNEPLETEVAQCPWNTDHRLLYIRVKNATTALRLKVDFGADRVEAYRLIGDQPSTQNPLETAIRLGSAPSMTILYEIVPARIMATLSQRLATVRVFDPAEENSKPLEQIVTDRDGSISTGSTDFQLAAAAAEFGLLLNATPKIGTANWSQLEQLVANIEGPNTERRKAELVELLREGKSLDVPKK